MRYANGVSIINKLAAVCKTCIDLPVRQLWGLKLIDRLSFNKGKSRLLTVI